MPYVTAADGAQTFYVSQGTRAAITRSHISGGRHIPTAVDVRTRKSVCEQRGERLGGHTPTVVLTRQPRVRRRGVQSGHRNAYGCIAAFSATDFRSDLDSFNAPTLVIHGDDDQVVPFAAGGKASAQRIENATLTGYQGAPHGITDTHEQQLCDDLLAFLRRHA